MKRRLLFVCVDNASRSPLAEALARIWAQGAVEAHSAGIRPAKALDPNAVAVMSELGCELADHAPQPVHAFAGTRFDLVVGIGCAPPAGLSAQRTERWEIPDPSGSGIELYRAVRDVLADRIRQALGPAVTITRDRRSVKAALLASQAKPVPMRVAAALAHQQLKGSFSANLKPVLNDAAMALA